MRGVGVVTRGWAELEGRPVHLMLDPDAGRPDYPDYGSSKPS